MNPTPGKYTIIKLSPTDTLRCQGELSAETIRVIELFLLNSEDKVPTCNSPLTSIEGTNIYHKYNE